MSGSLFVWEGSRKGEHNWYEDQLEGLSSVSLWLTAPSAEGTFWGARLRTRGLSSVMRVAHDSSFCRRSQVEFRLCGGEAVAFRSPPPPLRALTCLYIGIGAIVGRSRRLCQPPWPQPQNKKSRPTRMGCKSGGKDKPILSYSSGGGSGGGASLREATSPGVLVLILPLEGRGGSVSRRDHNQLAGSRAQLAWGCKSGEKDKPIPSYSSGEGVWGRGASLREAASPPESPNIHFFGREREGGAS